MENKFSCVFGISLIISSVLSFFFPIDNNIILGLTLSSFLFTILNKFINKNYYVMIIPMTIMMCFLLFSKFIMKLSFMQWLSTYQIMNSILLISFGWIFVSDFFERKRIEEEHKLQLLELRNTEIQSVNKNLDQHIGVLLNINIIMKKINDNVYSNASDMKKDLNNILDILENRRFINRLKVELMGENAETLKYFDNIEKTFEKYSPIYQETKLQKEYDKIVKISTDEKKEKKVNKNK